MQNKPLLFSLLAGAIGLWLLLSWDPVAREDLDDEASTPTQPAPSPEPTPTAAAPQPAPQPQQAEPPAHDPEPTAPEEPAAEAPVGDTPSGIKLVTASREELDKANLPPPSANGPLRELQQQFESAARDGNSAELETKILEVFKLEHVPPELLESAVCHGETCRVRTRWTPQRAGGFTLALTKLAIKMVAKEGEEPIFDRSFAVGEAGERNSNGERSIDVYVRKRPGATP